MDGTTPWTYDRLRRNGDWWQLLRNLEFLGDMRRDSKLKRYEINMTVQADNYSEMADFLELGRRLGCDAVLYYLIQNTGTHLATTYHDKSVADPSHPEHGTFLEVLRDPVFDDPLCQFYDIQILKEKALACEGAFDRLVAVLDRLPSAEELYQISLDHLKMGKLSKALELATAGARRITRDPAYLDLAGLALRQMGALDRAEARFRSVLTLAPEYPFAAINLGITLLETGRNRQGIAELRKVMMNSGLDDDVRGKLQSIIDKVEAQTKAP